MHYISTRAAQHSATLGFEAATLAGLAPDGGLYVPVAWPKFSHDEIAALAGLSYVETAVRVMLPFVQGSLREDELRDLCTQAYGAFAHDAVTPLRQLDAQHWLLELFHGPTLAFKDVALQLLGGLFAHFLSKGDKKLTIIGATSGDTGSAAIEAVKGKSHVEIFMLHPHGRVSDVQRKQMTTVHSANVHNVAIEGSFDDAQAIVKACFADEEMRRRYNLGAVNSINWARIMAQITYYFYAAVRLGAPAQKIAFSVPTGNFGDVFAGYVAAQMGLPVARLIVATNENDILSRALNSGDYSQGQVVQTSTPSMDIQVSSNFERLLYDVQGRDGAALAAQMRGFETSKAMQLTPQQRAGAGLFTAMRIDAQAMNAAMSWAAARADCVLDPHTAIGLAAAQQVQGLESLPIVTLATAHPAKFPSAVQAATGVHPALPARLSELMSGAERYDILPATLAAVTEYMKQKSA